MGTWTRKNGEAVGDHDLNEASDSQNHRPWALELDSYDAEEYKTWGLKHHGEDWHEQRETMLRERNFCNAGINKYSDHLRIARKP
ncbi:hypothetical protein MKZ38_006003 [Zalerion maritima]|uniref:Uncharacterized protein n=1 Tax=Zalerion maritima TaxID=339359 RepID=A0AAD5WPX1_9PEZI|nr:hypothetical protein MKZ38_006003 [Zalerion maritima]